jgi:hypothetical protein
MPVKMKKEIRKRVACHIGTTQEEMCKAEAECDGELCLYPVERYAGRLLPPPRPRQWQDCANALSD